MASDAPLDLNAIVAKVNREIPGAVVRASQMPQFVPRITSGSLTTDIALGGGWPVNHWHEIVGEFSSGKTALVMQMIAANQRLDSDWTVWWLAAEHFDRAFAELNGVDIDRVFVHDTNVTQEGLSKILQVAATRQVDCIVIDSLPALVPDEEAEGETGEWAVGLSPRLNNQFFRMQRPALARSVMGDERAITGFVINQWREKIGVTRGDPRTTPGGRQKDYEYWTKVDIRRTEWIKLKDEPIGQVCTVVVRKNKSHAPMRQGVFDYYFAEGGPVPAGTIDALKEVTDAAIAYDVVPHKGAWFYWGEEKFNGRAAVADALRTNEVMRRDVVTQVMAVTTHRPQEEHHFETPAKAVKATKAVKKARSA